MLSEAPVVDVSEASAYTANVDSSGRTLRDRTQRKKRNRQDEENYGGDDDHEYVVEVPRGTPSIRGGRGGGRGGRAQGRTETVSPTKITEHVPVVPEVQVESLPPMPMPSLDPGLANPSDVAALISSIEEGGPAPILGIPNLELPDLGIPELAGLQSSQVDLSNLPLLADVKQLSYFKDPPPRKGRGRPRGAKNKGVRGRAKQIQASRVHDEFDPAKNLTRAEKPLVQLYPKFRYLPKDRRDKKRVQYKGAPPLPTGMGWGYN